MENRKFGLGYTKPAPKELEPKELEPKELEPKEEQTVPEEQID
jgi:hypothetical protein